MDDHTDSTNETQEQSPRQKYYVYFFGQILGDYVKIGMTADVKARLNQLQTGNPHRLVVLRVIELTDAQAARDLEALFHRRYKLLQYHTYGEWYGVNPIALLMDVNFAIELGMLLGDAPVHDVPGTTLGEQGLWWDWFDEQPLYAREEWRNSYRSAAEFERMITEHRQSAANDEEGDKDE